MTFQTGNLTCFMPVTTRSNVPQHEPLRWNIAKAAIEFEVSRDTLRKALSERNVEADSDGLFSTQGIVQGLFGSLHIEKWKTQVEITKKLALENQIARAEVLDKTELLKVFSAVADEMTYRIQASGLTWEEKSDLQRSLASVPIGIDGVAKRQSRFRGAKNGQAEDDESES
jgi:hypothetical protein